MARVKIRVTDVESSRLVWGAESGPGGRTGCVFRMHFHARVALDGLTFGLGFMHKSNVNVSGPNSGRPVPSPCPRAPATSISA